MTAHPAARIDRHRRDAGSRFRRRCGIHHLVQAGRPETAIRVWRRLWKAARIEATNPARDDLFDRIA